MLPEVFGQQGFSEKGWFVKQCNELSQQGKMFLLFLLLGSAFPTKLRKAFSYGLTLTADVGVDSSVAF